MRNLIFREKTHRLNLLPLIASVAFSPYCIATGFASSPDSIKEGIPHSYPQKKLIAAGWDSPSPSVLLEHLKEIEQTPFHGVRIIVEIKDEDGTRVGPRRMFNNKPWKREWFMEEIQQLRKAKSKKLTDNFLAVGPSAKLDWFDDAGWEQVTDHFRIVAWIAKEAGLKGILFNPEEGTANPAFSYNRQDARTQHSFDEYAAKVRQRGREVMAAMAEEYPEMTLFCMFLNGGNAYSPFFRTEGNGGDPSHFYLDGNEAIPAGPQTPSEVLERMAPLERIEGGSYNLLPAFLNGWLDAIPPEMTLVDGLEQAYTSADETNFITWAHRVRNSALALVAPENRLKYRGQVQAGFGIYLDAYINEPGSRYYVGPAPENARAAKQTDGKLPRLGRLEASIRSAIENTDEYVWLWGEKHRWWPTQVRKVNPQTWEEIAPGISDALRFGVDPALRFKQDLMEANQRFAKMMEGGDRNLAKNLVKNGDFTASVTEGWSTRIEGESSIEHDASVGHLGNGSVRLSGEVAGSYTQEIPIRGAKSYYGVRARVRQRGSAEGKVRIRWKKGDGNYLLARSDNIFLRATPSGTREEWVLVQGVVAIPRGMDTLVVQLIASGPKAAEDAVWFDDVEVYRIND